MVKGLDHNGKDVFTEEISGWYTLANKARTYTVQLNEGDCLKAESIKVVAEMNKSSMSAVLKDYEKTQCRENKSKNDSNKEDK